MPKLFTRIDKPNPEWFTRSHLHEFYLPTETVANEPRIVIPRAGRYYEIDLYARLYEEERDCEYWELFTYDKLKQLPDFHGTSKEKQVYLYEIWADFGNDGHIHYDLMYWMLHPGVCDVCEPHQMYEHFYDHLSQSK